MNNFIRTAYQRYSLFLIKNFDNFSNYRTFMLKFKSLKSKLSFIEISSNTIKYFILLIN